MANFTGGSGDDILTGTTGDDFIRGDDGNDTLFGEGGEDDIRGENGDDVLHGGTGDDYMLGQAGQDTLFGDDGFDGVYGGDGDDILYGGLGNDFLNGMNDDDELYGEDGDDELYGGLGMDYIEGGEGNDDLHGGAHDDIIYGGAGNDRFFNFLGEADQLHGEAGEDYFEISSSQAVTANGGDDDDYFLVGDMTGGGQLVGGNGTDTLEANDLGTTDLASVVITHMEILDGGRGDAVRMNAGDFEVFNLIQNVKRLEHATAGSTDLRGILGTTESGEFRGTGLGDDEIIIGTAVMGDWVLRGYSGMDTLIGGSGNDSIYGGNDHDTLIGAGGDDYLDGDWGEDYLHGQIGNDTLIGDRGDDQLYGEEGNDILDGGQDADLYVGGTGFDTFILNKDEADGDIISDFTVLDTLVTDFSVFGGQAAFSGALNELIYDWVGGNTVFYADHNGDMVADETFTVYGEKSFKSDSGNSAASISMVGLFRDFGGDGTSDIMFQASGGGAFLRQDNPSSAGLPSNEGRNGFTSIGLADMDSDGVLDNVIRAANNNYVIQFSGENTGASTVGGNAFDIVGFADFDGDGADEALATSTNPADERLYIADDGLTTLTRIGFNAQTPIGFGDFDGDGADEILIEQSSGGKRLYDAGLGVISVGKARLEAEAIGDFNGDGLDDVLTRHPNKNNHLFLVEGDDTTPLNAATFIGFQSLELVAAGDFDGDGTLDILGNQNGTSFQMLTNGLTTLTAINFGNDTFEAIGDFNGDGMDDILLQRPNEQGRIVYSGDRNDTALIDALIGKSVRDVADYDGDGSDDLLVQDDVDGSHSILLSGVGSEIELDASLDGADVIDPNGLDTLWA